MMAGDSAVISASFDEVDTDLLIGQRDQLGTRENPNGAEHESDRYEQPGRQRQELTQSVTCRTPQKGGSAHVNS
jgi:hypothetical protein